MLSHKVTRYIYYRQLLYAKIYNTGDHFIVIIFEKDNPFIEYDGLKRPTLRRVKKINVTKISFLTGYMFSQTIFHTLNYLNRIVGIITIMYVD